MRRLLLCLVFFCANAHAATFTVDRTGDASVSACTSAPGDCGLRGAVTKANATSGADTINFDATVFAAPGPHVISLATWLPDLTGNVTITGPGAGLLTVKEGGAGETLTIFTVDSGVSATVSDLTISNGFTGINNKGTVTATGCTLSGNGIGIYNHGTVTATGCSLSGNTEGIVNFSTLSATDCTLSSNSSNGIVNVNDGTVTATNCTLGGNTNGIYNSGSSSSTATATNCTLSGNSNYGIYNGGGTITLNNTLVAGNPTNVIGTITDGGHNIISGTAADAGLDPAGLQNNGGPTKTIALLPGSPAIDAGDSTLTTDQRGFKRPSGSAPDIGAFEFGSLPTLSVNNPRSLPEGSADVSGSVTFDITLSAPSNQTVTVNYQTRDGINNPATAGSDYVEKHGKLTFAPGETLKRVTVKFIGDDKAETKETFFLDLLTPTNATIADSRGVGTIANDDATPSLFQDEPSS